MLKPKNGRLSFDGATMDYIRFGTGERALVMIPGVGDGLKTVKGMALPFGLLYKKLADDFTVYVFSRRNDLKEQTTTRDMAADLSRAMDELGLSGAAVVGVSQGGMIAQWLAIEHPEKVSRLVLTVTLAQPNDTMTDNILRWKQMAKDRDYKGIMLDTALRSYSPKKLKSAKMMYGLLGNIGKPKSFERFIIQADACMTHDAFSQLHRISCPTFVIGGTEDGIVTGEASREIAAEITQAKLYMYEGLSHGLYEEAPDFLDRVAEFCKQ